jgi:hypothetical protein
MKVIISHDIDHISVTEHLLRDFYIPKSILKKHIQLFMGDIKFNTYLSRWKDLFQNKLNNIKDLIEFDKENKIPSTFFIGMSNRLSLNYKIEEAKKWIEYIEKNGFVTGVHGIDFQNYENMQKEFKAFKLITSQKEFGIRMHYLRSDLNTRKILSKLGYSYESSIYQTRSAFSDERITCFPIHIMDSYLMTQCKYSKDQFIKIKEITKMRIEILFKFKINFLSIILHDVYFSKSYPLIYEWYIWLIGYLKERDIELTNYHQAVNEHNQKN